MSISPDTWPFADRASALRFSAFRNSIVRNDNSNRQLNLSSPPGAPGLSLARWLGDFTVEWGAFVGRLILEVEDTDIALGFESQLLPGGRGRLEIVTLSLLEAEDMPRYYDLMRPFPTSPRSWLVTIHSPLREPVPPELRNLADEVRLAAAVPTNFPG